MELKEGPAAGGPGVRPERIHYMELKGLIRGLAGREGSNPLHGVESVALQEGGEFTLDVSNPLHGVERP
jgi:hypothetical protein